MKYLKLMRVKHYLKNILIFLPLIFSSNLFNVNYFMKVLIAFIVFSMSSSIVYIINDIKDIEKDRNHPIKKNRPLASGEISINTAIILIIILIIINIIILYLNNILFSIANVYILIYVFLNILYSYGLKNIPLLDITILASGFIFRVLYGGSIINIEISNWLFLTILSGSFYMALGKRRNELIKLNGKETRNVLKFYNKEFLDKNMYMFLSLAIVFYSLWATLGIDNALFKYSIIFIILILMKYSMDVESDNSLGDPIEVILKDKVLITIGIIYAIYSFIALYIGGII